MYQILAQTFLGKELRVVRHPLSTGRKAAQEEVTLQEKGLKPSLDDTLEFAQNPREKRSRVFSRSAREKLRRAGEVCEVLDPEPSHWVFLTGTLPGSMAESLNAVADESGWVIKRVKDWLRFVDGEHTGFYCWERQKRGALHVHYCVHIPNGNQRSKCISNWKNFWIATLDAIGNKYSIDMYAKTPTFSHRLNKGVVKADAQEVRKSVGRYLAKYTSKETGKTSDGSRLGLKPPLRWWGSSQNLKDLVKSSTDVLKIPLTTWLGARNLYLRLKEELTSRLPEATFFESRGRDHDGDSLTAYMVEKWTITIREIQELIKMPCRKFLMTNNSQSSLDSLLISGFPGWVSSTMGVMELETLSPVVLERLRKSSQDLLKQAESQTSNFQSSIHLIRAMEHALWRTHFTSTLGAPIPRLGDTQTRLLTVCVLWSRLSKALRIVRPYRDIPIAILEARTFAERLTAARIPSKVV